MYLEAAFRGRVELVHGVVCEMHQTVVEKLEAHSVRFRGRNWVCGLPETGTNELLVRFRIPAFPGAIGPRCPGGARNALHARAKLGETGAVEFLPGGPA